MWSVEIAAVGAAPSAVVEIVADADRGVRKAEVVRDEVERVAPPGVARHADGVQDLFQVQPDLQPDLPLLLGGGASRSVTLDTVREGHEEKAQRPHAQAKTIGDSRQLEIR